MTTDYNMLDNSLGGKLVQSGAIALSVALPDFIESRPKRFAANLGIVGGLVALIARANLRDDDPTNDPDAMIEAARELIDAQGREIQLGPVATWASLAGVIAALYGLQIVNDSCQKAMAAPLRKLGVSHPNTLLGLATGAAVFAYSDEI